MSLAAFPIATAGPPAFSATPVTCSIRAMTLIKAYLGTLIPFLVIDIAWIALVLRNFYQRQIPDLLGESANGAAALVFYIAYVAGIVYLAILPALKARSMRLALLNGAALGALAYGTYTVTNYAIFTVWTLALVASDIIWGTVLTAVCAICGYSAARRGAEAESR